MSYLILIAVGVVSFAIGRKTSSRKISGIFAPRQTRRPYFTRASKGKLDEMREEAHEALTERTEKRKAKILDMMKKEALHQEDLKTCGLVHTREGITRINVEKLLDVSGATARKYLNELESENKIKQIGKTGRDVFYILTT